MCDSAWIKLEKCSVKVNMSEKIALCNGEKVILSPQNDFMWGHYN